MIALVNYWGRLRLYFDSVILVIIINFPFFDEFTIDLKICFFIVTIMFSFSLRSLDHFIRRLLFCFFNRTIEDSWLGPWKYILLGGWSNRKHVDSVLNTLVLNLKSKCKMDVNEGLLKIILEGSEDVLVGFDSKLYSRKGCFVGRARFYDKEKSNPFQNALNGVDKLSTLALKLIQDAKKELEGEDGTSREPIILVLDYDVQVPSFFIRIIEFCEYF